MGPFNPPSNQEVYILVCTKFVTKWVEAVVLSKATKEAIINFLFELFVRYPLTREIVTDGGSIFTSHKISATLQKYHIKRRITSPYHPQANGQLESTNNVLEAILTKTTSVNHQNWVVKLPEALCAYRTNWRNSSGYSQYQLVFNREPFFPIEFEIKALKTTREVRLGFKEAQKQHLQQLNELD